MKKIKMEAVICLSFFAVLTVFGFVSAFSRDKAMSSGENRALAQRPELTFSAFFSGEWAKSFEEYYTDQFPARDVLMAAGQNVSRFLTIPVKSGGTVISKDFDLGTGESLEDLGLAPAPEEPSAPSPTMKAPKTSLTPSKEPTTTPEPTPEPEQTPTPEPTPEPEINMDKGGYLISGDRIMHQSYTKPEQCALYAEMMNNLAASLTDRRVISMVVPNSYPFYVPSAYLKKSLDQKVMIEELYAMYGDDVIHADAYTPVSEHKDEYLYFRTDHHWTARGAYWAYTGLCEALGYEPLNLEDCEYGFYEGFLGSFYRDVKAYPEAAAAGANPDTVEYFVPPIAYTSTAYRDASMTDGWNISVVNTNLNPSKVSNLYMAFTNGDQALIHINTETKNGRSIAVVKESYGNALIPFLLGHYENIYVIDYRKYNKDDLPKLSLEDFVVEKDIKDVLIVSYPYVPNNEGFRSWLGMLVK